MLVRNCGFEPYSFVQVNEPLIIVSNAESSNGRTLAFEAKSLGSTPSSASRNYHAEWYERNKVVRRKQVGERRDKLKKEGREYVTRYLSQHPCVDCGEDDIVVLDFDHIRGRKKKNVCDMVRAAYTISSIQEEIDKCDVRCSNCHRKRHARDRAKVGSIPTPATSPH